VFDHPQTKSVFLCSDGNSWALIFVLTASCPASGYYQEESDSRAFIPSHQVLLPIDNISPEPSLLQAEESQISQSLLS